MIKKLNLLIKVIRNSKIFFKNPPNKKLLIFDSVGTSELNQSILKHFDHFVYEDRGYMINTIYISLDIIKHMICHLKFGLKNAYSIAIIKLVNPNLILTTINESRNFLFLAKVLNKEFNFLILQIASHYYRINEAVYLKKKGVKIYRYLIPNILLFSDFDKKNYEKISGIKIENYEVVGSLVLAVFKNKIKEKKFKLKKNKYDICLLSEIGAMELNDENADYNFSKLIKFVIQYSREKNKRIIFAFKRPKPKQSQCSKLNASFTSYWQEQEWYKKNLCINEYKFLKKSFRNQNFFSSYKVATESRVVIATMSTLLREMFSEKKKILACNFTSNKVYDFPIQGISSINFDCDYDFFRKRLDQIFYLSDKKYFKLAKFKKNYDLTINQKNQTIEKIILSIQSFIKKN
tara:strand:- start:884 stop:2098 length:1215 start_codon:yes stop_codon:yes gene_type:complete